MNDNHEFFFHVTYDKRRDIHSWHFSEHRENLCRAKTLLTAHISAADMLIARKPMLVIPSQIELHYGKVGGGGHFILSKDVLELPSYFMTNELFWQNCVPGHSFLDKLSHLGQMSSGTYIPNNDGEEDDNESPLTFAEILTQWSMEHGLLCIAVYPSQ